jgi:hypothetical protein
MPEAITFVKRTPLGNLFFSGEVPSDAKIPRFQRNNANLNGTRA